MLGRQKLGRLFPALQDAWTKTKNAKAITRYVLATWAYYIFSRFEFAQRWLFPFRWKGLNFYARPIDMAGVQQVFLMGEYQAIIPALQDAGPAPVVIDGGANIGTLSMLVLDARPDAIVHAFEPSNETHAILTKNIVSSGFAHWDSVQAALWKEHGQVVFQNEKLSTGSHLAQFNKKNSGAQEQVQSISFDGVIQQYAIERICVLKLDIEGSEQAFLEAARDKLWMVDNLIIEAHLSYIDYPKLYNLITRNFSFVQELKRGGSKVLLYATKISPDK